MVYLVFGVCLDFRLLGFRLISVGLCLLCFVFVYCDLELFWCWCDLFGCVIVYECFGLWLVFVGVCCHVLVDCRSVVALLVWCKTLVMFALDWHGVAGLVVHWWLVGCWCLVVWCC